MNQMTVILLHRLEALYMERQTVVIELLGEIVSTAVPDISSQITKS